MKLHVMQEEYLFAKPARDAAAKAKMEAEAPSTEEVPLHEDNEWNIRCLMILFLIIFMCVTEDTKHLSIEIDLIPDLLVAIIYAKDLIVSNLIPFLKF